MRYLEMALAFAAIGFVVSNTVLSLLTVLLWRAVRRQHLGSRALFWLRMLPSLGSASLVLGLVLPSYRLLEPRATEERAGPAIIFLGVLACGLVAAGMRRVIVSWLDTRRLERRWRAVAAGSAHLGIPVPAYRVPSDMPLASLVGIVRPRLFVSDRLLEVLTAEERQAVMDHEAGHLRSLDNLKRTAMKLAPDWLALSPVGRELETAWESAAEEDADDHAAGPDRARSLDLAGALVKAVRMVPVTCMPVSNFCEQSTVSRRLARLLTDVPEGPRRARAMLPRVAGVLAALGIAALLSGPASRAAYHMTEAAIRLLQ
jgi:beta-lactamase regulating signal transducer with metallopeptidase domain